jgi:ketosteroid isomerase-like protein
MKKALSVATLCIILSAGCSGPEPSSSPQAAASTTKAAVEAATGAFHQALRTDDIETFMSHVADDVVLMPPGEPAVRGKSALRAWYTGFLSQYHTTSLTLADQEVFVGDGWAVELGTFEWDLAPAAGGTPVLDRGNYMQVWKLQPDGKWQFAREVWNSSVPAAPPPAT